MYGGEAGGRQYRGGGCSAAVKNTNTTHNYLAFTFLLSSSQTQGTPERLHRVAKGLATISVPSQFGKAHWMCWLLLHCSAKKKKISHVLDPLYIIYPPLLKGVTSNIQLLHYRPLPSSYNYICRCAYYHKNKTKDIKCSILAMTRIQLTARIQHTA